MNPLPCHDICRRSVKSRGPLAGAFFPRRSRKRAGPVRRRTPASCPAGLTAGESFQCAEDLENRFITTTPRMISAMPIIAGASSLCPCTSHAMRAISTMPTPDQMA